MCKLRFFAYFRLVSHSPETFSTACWYNSSLALLLGDIRPYLVHIQFLDLPDQLLER